MESSERTKEKTNFRISQDKNFITIPINDPSINPRDIWVNIASKLNGASGDPTEWDKENFGKMFDDKQEIRPGGAFAMWTQDSAKGNREIVAALVNGRGIEKLTNQLKNAVTSAFTPKNVE